VIVASSQSSPSAKVDAMMGGAAAARHDLLLFYDDDVLVDPGHLSRLVAQQAERVGMVSSAAVGIRPENFWAELELAFMNGQFARLHLASDFLGISGALGKSMLMRPADIARAGGLPRTGGDCCEDAALTENLRRTGLRTVLGDLPVRQPIGRQGFGDVWRRHRRWLSCRRKYIPAVFAAEALFSAPVACVAAAVACQGFGFDPFAGAVVTAAIWCAVDSLLVLLGRWHWSFATPLAWLVREVLFLPLWASALFARTVLWYGRSVPVVGNKGS
jgi:ceramide glucosyltransferase